MAIKAGILKEFLSFSRTFKMWGVLIAVVAFSLLDPVLIKAMGAMATTITSAVEIEQAQETDTLPTSLEAETTDGGSLSELSGMFNQMDSIGYAVYMAMNEITSTCMLIIMLVMMAAAGGELKKRATIIPNCSGLTPARYLIPKFIFYPCFVFLLSIIGVVCSYLISVPLFCATLDFANVLLAGVMTGVYSVFVLALFMCIGICTARAGIAVAIVYGGTSVLAALFMGFNAEKFTPFSLRTDVLAVLGGSIDTVELLGAVGVSLVLCVICFFVTLMVLTARQIDNIGEESGAL